ncbi:MAG TPA: DUF4410 domain-containing protein [Chthoniobacterales bacterium]|nr:DUF4410 domain-containing protein [Chthoniobacterales bacterium]
MKSFLALATALLLCSCADMYVTKSQVTTASGHSAVDAKDFGSMGVRMTTCGVGAANPSAIYIRPFCIDTATFSGDLAHSDGEMPIRKALTPVEFAEDLKEELEKMAPTRILKDNETPRVGWLVEGDFQVVDGGDPGARFFFGTFGAGRSFVQLHVRVTDVQRHVVVYEFDMAGGSGFQGRRGTLRASGMGRASHFDLRNAAERIYITLSTNPYRYAAHADAVLGE